MHKQLGACTGNFQNDEIFENIDAGEGTPHDFEITPASDFGGFRGLYHSPASISRKFQHFENSGPCTRAMDAYNFLVSQRLTVILAGDVLDTRAD